MRKIGNKELRFREAKGLFSRIDRISICIKDTATYENYITIGEVSDIYDDLYIYGIGMIESEFYKDSMGIYTANRGHGDLVFLPCIEIVLSKKPKATMEVTICSRKTSEDFIKNDFPANVAVISFYDPSNNSHPADECVPVDYSSRTDRVCQVCIHDLDLESLKDFGLSYDTYFPEADAVAKFIYQAWVDGFNIICQCEYGESRSSGCAAAILEYFYKNGISVFTDYRYYPNQVVYHKVYEALGRVVRKRKRRQTNEQV